MGPGFTPASILLDLGNLPDSEPAGRVPACVREASSGVPAESAGRHSLRKGNSVLSAPSDAVANCASSGSERGKPRVAAPIAPRQRLIVASVEPHADAPVLRRIAPCKS